MQKRKKAGLRTPRIETDAPALHTTTADGRVVRNTGSWYQVRTDDGASFNCKAKGNFRLRGIRSTSPVAVGDRVTIRYAADGAAYITEIAPRRNCIVRRASNLSKQSHILAANVDLAVLVATVARPETSTTFIDRFLAGAEAYDVPACIALNKIDDLDADERREAEALARLYRATGYDVFPLSAATGEGVEALMAELSGKTCLLAGHSGVGKSTLLNRLVPEADARTAEISEAHHSGMHTTTFSALYALPSGGDLIDIPGIKGFGTFDLVRAEVAHYFRDIFRLSSDCRFRGCTHTHEPGCAVRLALDEGRLAPSRYRSYLSILGDGDDDKYRTAF